MVSGERDAASQDELRSLLRREQIVMTQASEKGREIAIPKLGRNKKVKAKELAVFTRQFSVMIDAGLPLVQCIDILAEQQQNTFFKQTLHQVRQHVEEGATLHAAMQKYPKVFDGLYTHMVEAGETGGVLDLILQRLATLIEKVVKLKRNIISASIYPAAVIFVAIAAVAVIMIVVIPQFEQIFLGLLGPGELLPLPTRIVMAISGFLAGWGGLTTLAAIIGASVGTSFYYKTPGGRWQIDKLLLKLPVFGGILRKSRSRVFREFFRRFFRRACRFSNLWKSLQKPPATSSLKTRF
jgi:type IV pilus assembly protein PilC